MTLQYTARPALYSDGTTKAVVGDWVTIYVNGNPDHYDARIIAPITRVCGGYRYVLQYTGPVLEQADVLSVVVQTCCDAVQSDVDALRSDFVAHKHVSAEVTAAASAPAVGKLAKWPSSGTFPQSSHSHPISGVVGLQAALYGKLDDSQATDVGLAVLGAVSKLLARVAIGAASMEFISVAGELTDGATPTPNPIVFPTLYRAPDYPGTEGKETFTVDGTLDSIGAAGCYFNPTEGKWELAEQSINIWRNDAVSDTVPLTGWYPVSSTTGTPTLISTPGHGHVADDITDMTPVGKAVLTAETAEVVRQVLGTVKGGQDVVNIAGTLTSDGSTPVTFTALYRSPDYNGYEAFSSDGQVIASDVNQSRVSRLAGPSGTWYLEHGNGVDSWAVWTNVSTSATVPTSGWVPFSPATGVPAVTRTTEEITVAADGTKLLVTLADGTTKTITFDV